MATYPARSKSITRLATRPVTRLAVGAAVHGSVPGVTDWHPDTQWYLPQVEMADGQVLEHGVAKAWDTFFRAMDNPSFPTPTAATHKEALLAGTMIPTLGARTLAGALVPAYASMPTPTNVGFVTGDYDRATGLQGDGASKYLSLNTVGDDLPVGDYTLHAFVTQVPPLENKIHCIIGAGSTSTPGSTRIARASAVYTSTVVRSRSSVSDTISNTFGEGYIASSRHESSGYIVRGLGNTVNITRDSLGNTSNTIYAWWSSTTSTGDYSSHRGGFKGYTKSIDLEYMDSCLTTLQSSIAAALA